MSSNDSSGTASPPTRHRLWSLTSKLAPARKFLFAMLVAAFLGFVGFAFWRSIIQGKPVFVVPLENGAIQLHLRPVASNAQNATAKLRLQLPSEQPYVYASVKNVVVPCFRLDGQLTDDEAEKPVLTSEPGEPSIEITCSDTRTASNREPGLLVTATCLAPPPLPAAPDDAARTVVECPDRLTVTLHASHAPQTEPTLEKMLRFPAGELEIVSVKYNDEEDVTVPSSCKPGWERKVSKECESVFRDFKSPEFARTPRVDRFVMSWALYARIHVVPFLMALMLAAMAACSLLALLSCVQIFVQPQRTFTKRTTILIEALSWMEATGPAMGFALTVVGLASAFDSTAGMAEGGGAFGGAVSIALASTLCGLGVRVFAHAARSCLQNYMTIYTDDYGLEIYPGSESELAPPNKPSDAGQGAAS